MSAGGGWGCAQRVAGFPPVAPLSPGGWFSPALAPARPLPATGSVAAISAAAGFIEGRLTPFRPRPSLLVALQCSISATPSPRFSFIKYAPPRVRLPPASASPSLCGGALRRPPRTQGTPSAPYRGSLGVIVSCRQGVIHSPLRGDAPRCVQSLLQCTFSCSAVMFL